MKAGEEDGVGEEKVEHQPSQPIQPSSPPQETPEHVKSKL